jgi:hypothetical protein
MLRVKIIFRTQSVTLISRGVDPLTMAARAVQSIQQIQPTIVTATAVPASLRVHSVQCNLATILFYPHDELPAETNSDARRRASQE